jgi:hypothetical protein
MSASALSAPLLPMRLFDLRASFELPNSGCPIAHLVVATVGVSRAPLYAGLGGTGSPRANLYDRSRAIFTPVL